MISTLMLKQIAKKIWKDPVGGNLIASFLLGISTLLYNFIVSQFDNASFKEVFIDFWTFQIELWLVVLIFFAFMMLFSLFRSKFKYDEDTLALDRALFNKIRNWEGMEKLVMEIKSNGFSSRPVKFNRIETMIDFSEESKKPDFHFFNPTLNQIKDKLVIELSNLDSVLTGNVYSGNNNWVSIPSEWKYSQKDRMLKAMKDVKAQEDIFTEVYQNFITKGRTILKV
jgi:hypothetical protein